DSTSMPGERVADGLSGLGIPDPHGAVEAARRDGAPVGADGNGGDAGAVPRERMIPDRLPRRGIPESEVMPGAARDEPPSVRTERDGVDGVSVTLSGEPDWAKRGRVPEAYPWSVSPGGDPASIAAEGDTADRALVSRDGRPALFARVRVPHVQGAVLIAR